MAPYIYWFLLALVLLGLEMATGTFYLLMLAIAMAVGGLAALFYVSLPWQFALSAVAVIIGTILLRRWKGGHVHAINDANLDAGQVVKVLSWHDDGTARVFYRGAEWDAEPETANMPRDVALYIKAMRGSTIILTERKSQQ
jgi:membrane protein implicated in regulation of membrane protease activity